MKRALALSLALVPQLAHAQTKQQCIEADTQAQELRRAGKLQEALAQLDVCTKTACPEMVRSDCSERVDEINRVIPSVVFDVKTSSGADVVDTRVEMDGRVLRERLDGLPVNVDPGQHTFVLSARGTTKTIQLLVDEGEKDRHVGMTVAEPLALAPPPRHDAIVPSGSGQRTAGLVLGVSGLLGVALGASFGGVAIAEHAEVAQTCPNNTCPSQAARDSVAAKNSDTQAFATVSTVAFIAGAALLAAGVVVYVTAPRAVRVGLGPGAISISGVF